MAVMQEAVMVVVAVVAVKTTLESVALAALELLLLGTQSKEICEWHILQK